ncbi:discoidin domain-containing receptor 2-like isoform X1 [Megachile rotundata]|uniref:discoidin domain-containing receptor 2-like isoform X1 n=2 Tax=Megachile rotundata TaxID=143995 RepID=UPI000614E8CB|nr:PREDICTED: discoidin domain-containing receptor 2-like isoform X2 [Megachile rotundata]
MRRALSVISFGMILVAASSPGEQRTARNIFGQCILPLGMEEGKIPDDAITASSSYETKSVGPQNARIRQEKNGGAWCPKAQISSAIREYLEIDLTRNHLIAWTETQGRFGNGQGQEYAEAFFLEYWRDSKWHQYKNLRGDRVLRGNSNTYLVEKQKLDLPFVASRVRFVPYSLHPRTVCMRVEIYGCVWEQYVTRYSAPKGSNLGPGGCNIQDSSYDGVERDSLLVDGLGQLTDGILGEASEIFDCSMSGTNWVGWSERDSVELVFQFQEPREFHDCSVHVARLPEMEVEPFSTLRVWVSPDGENYPPDPEKLELTSIDSNSSTGGTVLASISLRSKIGRFVKMEFSLSQTKWLLLSEVNFHTAPDGKNRSNDSYSIDRPFRSNENQSESRSRKTELEISGSNETEIFEIREEDLAPDAFPVGTSQTYIGLVSGSLTVIVLFLTCMTFLIKQRGRNKVALLQKHTALLCDSSTPGIAIAPKDVKLSNGLSLVRKPITVLGSNDSQDAQNPRDVAFNDRRPSTVYETTRYDPFSQDDVLVPESSANAVANERTESCSDFNRKCSFTRNKAEFTMPTATSYPSKNPFHFHSTGKTNQKVHEGYYAATDILTIKKRESTSSISSPFTSLCIREKSVRLPRTIDPCEVRRVSRHRLRILDKLGEGNFGLVHLCEAKGIASVDRGTIFENRQTVIVRSLWRGVVDSLRLDFTKDMRILATLRHTNVAKMIALVEEEPFGAVFEYGQFGDLHSFLRCRDSEVGNENDLSYGDRLSFIIQIASGMKYLESLNIPHCDLAARNCIVSQNLTIKVSDHAMFCTKYNHQYFVDGSNAKIPLRWMAWEAVLLNKRSCRADVWSFAVTVWEICMDCKETPYAELTSEQVLENCGRWYQSESRTSRGSSEDVCDGEDNRIKKEENRPRVLSRPPHCSDDLYRVMNKCWSKRSENRPSFEEIYLYLERLALD